MKIGQVFFTILAVVLLSVLAVSGEDVGGGWAKVIESDGITGYIRATQTTNVNEIKAIGTVAAPVAVLEAVLRDDGARTQYSESCIEASRIQIPGLENTKDSYYSYHKIDMPWPFYDRDSVGRIDFMIDEKTGALFVRARATSTDFKVDDYTVRAPLAWAKWILTPQGKNKTVVLYQVIADPGGYLPTFLVNMYSQDLAVKTILGIRKMVKMDKYKDAKSVITTTPWIKE
jgi:hypothetical protein